MTVNTHCCYSPIRRGDRLMTIIEPPTEGVKRPPTPYCKQIVPRLAQDTLFGGVA